MVEHLDAASWATAANKVEWDGSDIYQAASCGDRSQRLLRTVLDHCSLFGLTTGLRVLEIGTDSDELESIFRAMLPDCEYHRKSIAAITRMPFELHSFSDLSFDVVLFDAISHRVETNTISAILPELHARLRPGGIVVVSDFVNVDASDSALPSVELEAVKHAVARRLGPSSAFAWDRTSATQQSQDKEPSAAINIRAMLANEVQDKHFDFAPDDLSFEMDRPFGRALSMGVPFGIVRGKWNLIIGRSGSGKTSFLRALQGDLKPYARQARGFPSRRYFYMPQNVDVFENLTPVQNVRAYGGKPDEALAYFDELGMIDFHTRKHAVELSGGERQRLLVAQIMAARPELIILDEPSKGLDRAGRLVVFDALADCFAGACDDGTTKATLVCADHDFAAVYRRFDYVFEIRNGRQILVWSK